VVRVTVEIQGGDRPACVVDTISRYFTAWFLRIPTIFCKNNFYILGFKLALYVYGSSL
jgi:hypothetical protein